MSLLLVVTSTSDAQLQGVIADAQRTEDGARVFYRAEAEVARVPAGRAVVVRDVGLVRSSVVASGPSIRDIIAMSAT